VNRRAFVTGLGAVLAAPLGAEAQQAGISIWACQATQGIKS
jgi:hypothetical protein